MRVDWRRLQTSQWRQHWDVCPLLGGSGRRRDPSITTAIWRATGPITVMLPVWQCGHSRNDCPVSASIPSNYRLRSSLRVR